MNLFILIMIAISLSMDAFSMSLVYGTLNIDKKDILILSLIVGIYHFVMPLIGYIIGNILLSILPLSPELLVFIILTFIGLEMIIDTLKKNEQVKKMSILQMILFGFTVSIDSFSVGIGLKKITSFIILGPIIFSIFSFFFTFLGATIGKKINQMFGVISTIIGGIILILIAILYIV